MVSYASLPSNTLPRECSDHCNTCVIADFRAVTEVLRPIPGRSLVKPRGAPHGLHSAPSLRVPLYNFVMPRSLARGQDILARPAPKRPPRLTSRRIGIHTSIAGGIHNAAESAYRIGCNTLQIFSSSPRQWAPYELSHPLCEEMLRLRRRYGLKPLVIHTNYLVNLASTNPLFLKKSIAAFRGEVERALAMCADYLVLHPGSFRGTDREAGLLQTAAAIAAATQDLDLSARGLTILIENTAGAEFSLGSSFEQVAEVIDRLRGIVPIAACIDTCHTHVAGYDIASKEGIYQTLQHLDETVGLNHVKVVHCNDAKAPRGSKLDRHEQIGKGTIGKEPFRILLNDLRLAHAAFIAETPIAKPGDDRRNVEALKRLVE
jgi:deoxyribonuclease-4